MKSNGGYSEINEQALYRPDLMPQQTRIINMNQLGRVLHEVDDPPIKGLFVYNTNPAAVAPNQSKVLSGFKRDDLFMVVHDIVMTDTCRFADVVLPATSHWENTDLFRSYWHLHVALAEPVIERVGEAKPNVEVFQLLAKAMGYEDACFQDSTEQLIEQALDYPRNPGLSGITLDTLRGQSAVKLKVTEKHVPFTHFYSEEMAADGYDPLPTYTPLAEQGDGLMLITPPNHYFLNSTFAGVEELIEREGQPTLQMSASDAAERNIHDGDLVCAGNERGRCQLVARITDAVQPGVVVSQGVWWPKHSRAWGNINQTTPDRIADMGGGAVFFSNRVTVEKLA